ncbi:MAG: mercury methylation ferredoxin HgcB [Candidatus Margulisbacteria bacterium]|nr:mercury methylation ferredoxin HgcB [Candidatus Margulisiibacteriota bacterium]
MKQVYLKNVSTLTLDSEKCTGCGMCTNVCPHNVFSIQDNTAVINDKDLCMECGACEKNCAFDAVHVKSGVGCAAGIIYGTLRGTEPTCNCSGGGCC